MATVEGDTHMVRYANLAFCRLVNRSREELVGTPLCVSLPGGAEFMALLDQVYRSGEGGVCQGREHAGSGQGSSSYVIWPVTAHDPTSGVVIQVTESPPLYARMIAMNEALVLGALRQQQLAASADETNGLLQAEIVRRMQSECDALNLTKELGEANANLSALATTDALTGLANRRLFDERLMMAWQRALRQQSCLAVILIDVDMFKKYNDTFGHPAGDKCLRKVAAAIGAEQRQVDVAARLGGEEFGLLLPDTDLRGAQVLAERMCLAVEQLGLEHPLNVAGVVTISLGVAAGSPAKWRESARLLSAADEALYQSKAGGRNRVCTAA